MNYGLKILMDPQTFTNCELKILMGPQTYELWDANVIRFTNLQTVGCKY